MMIKSLLTETLTETETLSDISKGLLRTLLYFDIFHHPLTAEEIHRFLQNTNANFISVNETIEQLADNELIHQSKNYFFVSTDLGLVHRRKKGEEESTKAIRIAKMFSKLIARFPFVRAVFISGSLSKGFMDKNSDIDFFVVTTHGRMWLSRTLLVLFKKILLFNSHKYFCVNYFVTESNLVIPDRNIFTATELVSVIPTYNYKVYEKFLALNSWTKDFLPNTVKRSDEHCVLQSKSIFKNIFEKLLQNRFGEFLDTYCFRLTLKFWKKKFKHFDENTFDHNLRSRKNVSKHHPLGYQKKVLTAFEEKIKFFEEKYEVQL